MVLRSVSGPEPVETLPTRAICFAYQYATLCERWARENPNMPFGELAESVWPGAGAFWQSLEAASL